MGSGPHSAIKKVPYRVCEVCISRNGCREARALDVGYASDRTGGEHGIQAIEENINIDGVPCSIYNDRTMCNGILVEKSSMDVRDASNFEYDTESWR